MSEPLKASVTTLAGGAVPRITLAAAGLVLLLALGAAFFPGTVGHDLQGVFLVFDSPGTLESRKDLFQSLASFLGQTSGHPMDLVLTTSRQEFMRVAASGVDFALCPDGLALDLVPAEYGPLVAGRRKLPTNLRPRGVMVFRKSTGAADHPWVDHPRRTVFGDSLSLVAIGGAGPLSQNKGCAFGPDPYDHGPVLHALRLGVFDFALVRQWDAELFFSRGLLDSSIWGLEMRTMALPDIVMMASREIPLVDRLKWADSLSLVGRTGEPSGKNAGQGVRHLEDLGLVGFNILLEPDFELVRRKFVRHWPAGAD